MAFKFEYRKRAPEAIEARANQRANDYKSFIKDTYRVYTAKKGENAIRFLPPVDPEAPHYGIEIFAHYSVGPDNASVLCPYRMFSEPCPICEERARLERRGDTDGAKELNAAKRVVAWVIDRKDEKEGVLAYSMPWTLDRDIAKICKDRESGEYYSIDSPTDGYDVFFDKEGEGLTTKYTGCSLSRRPSSVSDEYLKYISENPLQDIFVMRDYDEIKSLFEGASPAEDDDKDAVNDKTTTSERAAPAPTLQRRTTSEPAAATSERANGGAQLTKDKKEEEPPFDADKAATPKTTDMSRGAALRARLAARK